jgi:tetratricopeptide (TPR) repeat protein
VEARLPKISSALTTYNMVTDDGMEWAFHSLGFLYANQGKLDEAEKMYQRALQGYEKALGAENVTTYIPALNTIWAFGSLFERQADLAKAKIMYSKALVGYDKVVGPDHPMSRSLQDNLRALDAKGTLCIIF